MNKARKLVVKIGGSLLLTENKPDFSFMQTLVESVITLLGKDKKVVLVSSGAIAMGRENLGSGSSFIGSGAIPSKQALASIGQIHLMQLYVEFFEKYDVPVGQVLLSAGDLSQRSTYINARNTILTLLKMGAIPVVNENDTVAVDEIKFGDNDTLSALVAGLIEADCLIILSDVEGLYTSDPKKNSQAKLVSFIEKVDKKVERMALGTSVEERVGGMQTKIEAAKIATRSGIPVIIGGGKDFLGALARGQEAGTVFLPVEGKLQARKKWIAYGTRTRGALVIDAGAKRAIVEAGSSLLPVGIKDVRGRFQSGDAVSLLDAQGESFARGIAYYSSDELRKIKGLHTHEIVERLGYRHYNEAVHRDNLVIL